MLAIIIPVLFFVDLGLKSAKEPIFPQTLEEFGYKFVITGDLFLITIYVFINFKNVSH